jgi:23S rRNA pseudouridine2605 synthase
MQITDGRVTLNGKIVTELGIKANPNKDKIQVDGKLVTLPTEKEIFWIVMNKPRGVLTTMEDDKNRDTVLKFIPKANELRLVPVGRMDRESTGLLLLTNDVGWIHPLTHPSFQHHRRYELVVKGTPNVLALEKLAKGELEDEAKRGTLPMCPCTILGVDSTASLTLLDIKLREASPIILEEIVRQLGCELINFKRTEFSTVRLGSIRKGEWRMLSLGEVGKLKESCKY